MRQRSESQMPEYVNAAPAYGRLLKVIEEAWSILRPGTDSTPREDAVRALLSSVLDNDGEALCGQVNRGLPGDLPWACCRPKDHVGFCGPTSLGVPEESARTDQSVSVTASCLKHGEYNPAVGCFQCGVSVEGAE